MLLYFDYKIGLFNYHCTSVFRIKIFSKYDKYLWINNT